MSKKRESIYCLIIFSIVVCSILNIFGCGEPQKESKEDKAAKVATFLEDFFNRTENTGGKMTCEARRIGNELVQCDLHFSSDMDNLSVIVNTKGIAETNGQVGIGATIYFAGWKGKLKVCEYKWDIYSQTVSRVK